MLTMPDQPQVLDSLSAVASPRQRLILQTQVDTLAWGMALPLQVVRFAQLATFDCLFRENIPDYARHFGDASAFSSFIENFPADPAKTVRAFANREGVGAGLRPRWHQLVRLAEALAPHVYCTRSANPHPILRPLNDNDGFRAWSLFFVLKLIQEQFRRKKPGRPLEPIFKAHGPFGREVGNTQGAKRPTRREEVWFYRFPDLDRALLVFPALPFADPTPELGSFDTAAPIMLANFETMLNDLNMGDPVTVAQVERARNARLGIAEPDLRNRLRLVGQAFWVLAKHQELNDELVGRQNFQRVAQSVAFSFIMFDYQLLPGQRAGGPGSVSLYFRLARENKTDHHQALEVMIGWGKNADPQPQVDLSVSTVWEQLPTGSVKLGKGAEDLNKELRFAADDLPEPEAMPRIAQTYSWFLDTLHLHRRTSEGEAIAALRSWLLAQFEALSDFPKLMREAMRAEDTELFAPLAKPLAERIRDITSADAATFHRFNYVENQVEVLHISTNVEGITPRDWVRLHENAMAAAATDPGKREQSIVYRTVAENRPLFAFHYEPEEGLTEPPDQPLLIPPQVSPRARSANTAPISVFGRPWGVIGVLGLEPYQFSSATQHLLTDTAELLSSRLYSHWMTAELATMSLQASRQGDTAEKYQIIAQRICDTLLCSGCALWRLDPSGKYDELHAVAWVGRSDLDENFKPRDPNTDASDDVPKISLLNQQAILPKVLHDASEPYLQGRLGEAPFDDKWLSQPHTCRLRDLGYRWVVLVPLRGREEGKLIGSLSLYLRTEAPYDDKWRGVIATVAEHVALIMRIIDQEVVLRTSLIRPLRHQWNQVGPRARSQITKVLGKIDNNPELRRAAGEVNLRNELAIASNDLRVIDELISGLLDQKLVDETQKLKREDMVVANAREIKREPLRGSTNVSGIIVEIGRALEVKYGKRQRFVYRGTNTDLIRIHSQNITLILDCLLDNAFKYAPPFDEVVAYFLHHGSKAHLQVVSWGPEIREDEEARIFDLHVRGDAIGDVPGEGIGLFHANEIAKLYNTSISYKRPNDVRMRLGGNYEHRFSLRIQKALLGD